MKAKTRFHKLTAWLLTLAMLMAFIPSYTLGVSANTGAFEGERVTIGGGSTTYTVTLNTSTNGTVSADKENAAVGETVNLTIEPATGYELDTLTVEDADNGNVTVTDNKFTMPAKNVTVTATFKVKVNYPDGTIIIPLDTNGVPTSISGTGWSYDSGTNTLALTNGYSYAVDGACEAIVNNSGTIVGGTYNNTVNNVGDGDTTWKEKFGVIDGGIFNGDVYNADGFDICTINGGAFNGTVTNKNRGVVNDGIFGGEFLKLTGSTVSGGTFVVEFVVNGGIWATGYTVPTTYTYANGLVLPTSENISNGTLSFDGWYDNETFNGLPLTEISAGSYGKLTFYARFIDGIAGWEIAGNQAVENTDYTVDADGNYTVLTAKGLAKIANIVNGGDKLLGKTVTLATNIDLLDGDVYQYGATTVTERNSWIPIDGFAGTFNGNGKKINDLYILTTNKDAGLFGSNVGTIKELEIASGKVTINVSSGNELHAGGIAATTSGLIDNCINRAEIYSNDTSGSGSVYIGGITGLVGTSTAGAAVSTVSDCTNYGTVSSLGNSSCGISGGGIAGYHFSGRITGRKTLITRCVNEGTISIEPGTGGWAGGIAGTVKSNSNSNTSITATVTNCANKGSVGSNMAGGITGYNTNAAYVYNCYNTGSITGNTNAGGIVGLNYYSNATVANCYSTGSVSNATNIGGIVGRLPSGSISNCYYLSSAATDPYGYKANAATFNDCVAFTSAEDTHTLTSVVNETTDLLTALKAWVSEKNVADYIDWKADAQNSNYPILTEYVVKSYYTVTFETNGGTINSGNVTSYYEGNATTLPTDVTKDGYLFGGWYENAEFTGDKVTEIATTETGNKMYWAKWSAIMYNVFVNGIQVSSENASDILGTADGDGATVSYNAETNTLTLTDATINNTDGIGIEAKDSGIIIVGVDTDADGANTVGGSISAIKAGGEITIKGKIGDITGGSIGGVYSTNGDINIDNDAVLGNITSEWYTLQTDEGNIVIDGAVGNINGQIAITSEYNHDVVINGKVGDITGVDYGIFAYKDCNIAENAEVGDISGNYNGIIAIANIEINGKVGDVSGQNAIRSYTGKVTINSVIGTVKGVCDDETATVAAIAGAKGIELAENIAIKTPVNAEIKGGSNYIIYDTKGTEKTEDDTFADTVELAYLYTVTFETGDGSDVEEQSVINGAVAADPDAPTLSGYKFDGWYTDTDYTTKYDFDTPVSADITIYAKWTKNSSGGGSSSNTTTTTTKNDDGSTTKTTTNKRTGTTTETTTHPDGSTTKVETKKDGTVTTTEKDSGGNTTTTVENPDGSSTTEETKKDGTKVTTETTASGETTAEVEAKGETEVVIPVDNAEDVYEVVITDASGNETVITDFETVDNGIAITVPGDASVSVSKGSKKEFVDVHPVEHWSEKSVDYVYIRGLMKGTSETQFSPDVHLTRAMLVTVLYRIEGEPEIANDESFADVEGGSYYEKAVAWAKANGIVNGTSATTFEPNTNITREQIAAIMHRYADFKEHDVQVGENTNILSYTDAHHISEYAVSSMQYAVGSGLIKGKTETTLNPLDNATRAEAAAILERFSKIIQ